MLARTIIKFSKNNKRTFLPYLAVRRIIASGYFGPRVALFNAGSLDRASYAKIFHCLRKSLFFSDSIVFHVRPDLCYFQLLIFAFSLTTELRPQLYCFLSRFMFNGFTLAVNLHSLAVRRSPWSAPRYVFTRFR